MRTDTLHTTEKLAYAKIWYQALGNKHQISMVMR